MQTKKLLLIGFLSLCTYCVKAQEKDSKTKNTSKIGVGLLLGAGSQGAVAELKVGIKPKLALRAGIGMLPIGNQTNVLTFKEFDNENVSSAKFTNIHLLLDYAPFKGKGFRLVGGAGYFTKATGEVMVTPTNAIKFMNINFQPSELGNLKASLKWEGIAPYAGIGLFKCFPKKSFNINLDLGTYYLPAPEGHFVGTQLFIDNNQNDAKLTENASDYRWLPVLQLNFNFKF